MLIPACLPSQVEEYLNDVLRRIMSHPIKKLRELLPDKWVPAVKDSHGLIVLGR